MNLVDARLLYSGVVTLDVSETLSASVSEDLVSSDGFTVSRPERVYVDARVIITLEVRLEVAVLFSSTTQAMGFANCWEKLTHCVVCCLGTLWQIRINVLHIFQSPIL